MRTYFGIADMKWIIITSAIVVLAGCASTTAPSGWLPYAEETTYDSRGGWIDLRLNDGKGIGNSFLSSLYKDNGNIMISGELIAIHEDSSFILIHEDYQKTILKSVNNQDIVAVKIGKYDYHEDELKKHAVYGTASAFSHGWWSVFSAPIWIMQGISAFKKFANSSIIKYSYGHGSLTDLKMYARFPGGIPKSLDRKKIDRASREYFQAP